MLQTDVYLGLRVDELITGGLLAGGGGAYKDSLRYVAFIVSKHY